MLSPIPALMIMGSAAIISANNQREAEEEQAKRVCKAKTKKKHPKYIKRNVRKIVKKEIK